MSNLKQSMYHTVGLNNHITDDVAKEIIESPFLFTKGIIDDINLEGITEDDFNKLKTNFTYKYIGKLHTNYKAINKIKINSETFKNTHKEWKKKMQNA